MAKLQRNLRFMHVSSSGHHATIDGFITHMHAAEAQWQAARREESSHPEPDREAGVKPGLEVLVLGVEVDCSHGRGANAAPWS